jgi:hypothetical protein
MKKNRIFGIILIILSIYTGCSHRSGSVFEPVIVGSPPRNAYIGLTRLDNGEIRHYNYTTRNREKRAFYIRSRDNGFTWDTVYVENEWIGADVKSPLSGEYIRLATAGNGVVCIRSEGGIDGKWTKELVHKTEEWEGSYIMLKPPVFIMDGKRILVGAHSTKRFGCGVFYSDDDGLSWSRSQFVNAPHHEPGGIHKSFRWNHGAVEPTLVEMNDGRIWMIARTAQDHHYESFSEDGGMTWSALKPSRFYGTITMPTIGRLKDGRLLFIWNNSTPLPEKEGNDGIWEDVFTNRDVLHAAISDDDGETWKGFRELILNPVRNDPDYALADQSLSIDMSVHQSQFVELENGKILVSLGQHELHRKLLMFDPEWLYETSRSDDFSEGLKNLSTFLYRKGVIGHCAYNRAEGAILVPDPADSESHVLRIARTDNEELEIPHQGAVWNFPALKKGSFETSVYIDEGSKGGRISLTDRWFNPSDTTAFMFAMYNFELEGLQVNRWHKLRFEWDLTKDKNNCMVTDENRNIIHKLPLIQESMNGISYVHFISVADREDEKGFMIGSLNSEQL